MVSQELYSSPMEKSTLEVPKQNSLTDNMMRSTLGCEER